MHLCQTYMFRCSDTVTATHRKGSMEDAQRWLGKRHVRLNRGDFALGQDAL
jgi:hypothetical protein